MRFGGTVFFPILHLSRRKGPLCVFDKEASLESSFAGIGNKGDPVLEILAVCFVAELSQNII